MFDTIKFAYKKFIKGFKTSWTAFLATIATLGGTFFAFGGELIDAIPYVLTPEVGAYLKSFLPGKAIPLAVSATSFILGIARLRSVKVK